jgi:hypothetical protein
LDGNEKSKRAVESDVASFRQSWNRPKWHILVQYAKTEDPYSGLMGWRIWMLLNIHHSLFCWRGGQTKDRGIRT